MADKNLLNAIRNHILCCKKAVAEAIATSSDETIQERMNDLKIAQMMPSNPELFFEVQRALYL